MKQVLFAILATCSLNVYGQPYLISFAGTGASTTVNTVKVENLTAGTSVSLNGSDVLRLTIVTGINSVNLEQLSEAKIFPNPMTDNSILQVSPPVAGEAIIILYDITGKLVGQFPFFMEKHLQEFRLSGLGRGLYLISVKGNTYKYSVKLLCTGKSGGTINIEQINNNQSADKKPEKRYNKGIQVTVDMNYTIGDRLKFTGISDIYSTIITDIPESDKTITFNFIACTDGDNNKYPIVKIDNQIWMAENLKTTKYKDGTTSIPNVTTKWIDLTTPAYCWYDHDEATNKATYGALYNWYAVNTGNLCPTGWHVPTITEWTSLITFLGGSPDWHVDNEAGGRLKETGTMHWLSPNTGATNETGFTALPGGYKTSDDQTRDFHGIYWFGYWWSATEGATTTAWSQLIRCDRSGMWFGSPAWFPVPKGHGYSIRCTKD